jgi:phospholipid N-methyltransferase
MISHPRRVGAVWPTSRWAVQDLLDMGDLSGARTVVEFGVGTGVYTEEILKRLHPEGTFLAFEIEPDLASAVAARLKDPRLHVIYIVSSVPFTSLPADVRQNLLEAARGALAPDGQMLVLQYSTTVLPDLERTFTRIRRRFSPLNIPPAFLFACSTSETPNEQVEDTSEADGAGKTPYVLG